MNDPCKTFSNFEARTGARLAFHSLNPRMNLNRTGRVTIFIISIISFFLIQSCRKEVFYNDPDALLRFNEDTVHFDTVFTTVGSITLPLKIFNDYNDPIIISSIELAGGEASQFRMNVDGDAGTVFHDIEIPANDSLYIFIEVTVDPNALALPYVIEDSIVFETNGNLQDVNLVAWGQNAHFHFGEIVCGEVWEDDLPHVIYSYVYVDTACLLTIEKGCNIYVHGGSSIIVQGTLQINGEADSIVRIQGDRLEDFYKDVPGQWNGIYILRNSAGSDFKYVDIFNSIDGISMGGKLDDEFTFEDIADYLIELPELTISNSTIRDCQNNGIFTLNSKIIATNVLIYNCGLSDAALFLGGDYDFKFCTLANYSSTWLTHQTATLGFLDYYAFSTDWIAQADLTANFTNCIVYGSLPEGNEIVIDTSLTPTVFDFSFDHCILRTDIEQDLLDQTSSIFNSDPVFENIGERKYNPFDGSPAIDAGINIIGIDDDLLGMPRPVGVSSDIGAFEKQ